MAHHNTETADKDPDDFDSWLWSAAPQAELSSMGTASPVVQQPPPITPPIDETIQPPSLDYSSMALLTDLSDADTWDEDSVDSASEALLIDFSDNQLVLAAAESPDYGIEVIDEDYDDSLDIDPAFASQIAATAQQDYSRRVSLLTARLISTYELQGGVTYRDLVFALRTLDRDVGALQQLCRGLAAADVRVKRAPRLYNFREMPIEDRVLIQTIFHPILIRDIAPEIAIRRLGYTNVRLSKANQALLVDALERHQLSRIEERELFAEIGRLGGPNSAAARPLVHQLINDNLWMVARIVRSYLGRGLPLADLFQEGVFGLYRAIATFDVETGSRFMKYGGFWVRQVILRAVSDKARLIRLPVHVGEMMQVSEQTTLELEQALQRPPTTTELASALGTTPKRLTRLLLASQPPLSLERSDEDLSEALIDADPASAPETAAVLADLRTLLRTMLAQFPERERQIMELRYGLIDSKQRSLEEVASEFGITRERVRQIESKILQRLGHERFAGRLAGYLDSSDKLAWGNAVGSDRYWTGEILQNDVRIVDIRDFKNFVFGLESLSLASLRKLRWRYVLKAKELSLDRFPLKNGLSLDAVLDEITFQTLIRNIAAELQSINKYLVDIGDQTYVESPRVKRVLSSIHIEVAKFHRKLTIDQINIIERSFWYRVVMGYLQQLNTAINEQERIRTASEETKQTAKSSKSVARSKRKNCSTLQ